MIRNSLICKLINNEEEAQKKKKKKNKKKKKVEKIDIETKKQEFLTATEKWENEIKQVT